jgi:colanic acid biosynthesis glycosyl transferase WcaI
MKICFCFPYFPPELGAASNRAVGLVDSASKRGWEVAVITPKPSYFLGEAAPADTGEGQGSSAAHAVTPVVVETAIRLRGRRDVSLGRIVREILAGIGALPTLLRHIGSADLVYASSPPLPYAAAAVVTARLLRKAVVLEIRDIWPEVVVASSHLGGLSRSGRRTGEPENKSDRRARAIRRLGAAAAIFARMCYALSSAVVAVTPGDRQRLVSAGVSADKVLLAPNGVDDEALAVGARRLAVRAGGGGTRGDGRENAVRRSPFVIGYAGRLGPAQNVGLLLDAAALVELPLEIRIWGEGPDFEKLKQRAASVPHAVEMHPPVARRTILEELARCDAAFVPLATENLSTSIPSKLFEAMALGLPILAAATGDAADLLQKAGAGRSVKPGDPQALASAIEEMASSDDLLEVFGRSGHLYVERHYRRDRIFSDLLQELSTRLLWGSKTVRHENPAKKEDS